jgi:hypothetical protein
MTDVPPAAATRAVILPAELVQAIEQRMQGASFDSPDAFIAFVLGRLLDQPGEGGFSAEDEKTLKERLRSLGYID